MFYCHDSMTIKETKAAIWEYTLLYVFCCQIALLFKEIKAATGVYATKVQAFIRQVKL